MNRHVLRLLDAARPHAVPTSGSHYTNGFRGYRWRGVIEWAVLPKEDIAYLQAPGVAYREIRDMVVLRLARCVKYHRAGPCAYLSVGRLIVYRKVAGIRSYLPTFKFF